MFSFFPLLRFFWEILTYHLHQEDMLVSPSMKIKAKVVKPNDAVRHGNYHQYYEYRSQDSRPQYLEKCFPKCLEKLTCADARDPIYMLDIGCNNGKLTYLLREIMQGILKDRKKQTYTLGIDIDQWLVNEAATTYGSEHLEFAQADIYAEAHGERRDRVIQYMTAKGIQRFDFVSCFSTLMYVHLNHGDDGLKKVLDYVCKNAKILVLELQSWKSYRDHARRMRRDGGGEYEHYSSLEWRGSNGVLEQQISDYVISKGFNAICSTVTKEEGKFDGDVVIYAKN